MKIIKLSLSLKKEEYSREYEKYRPMKKIKEYITLGLCILGVFTSCYDDKGNYDYHDIQKIRIDTTGLDRTLWQNVLQGDSIFIRPEVIVPEGTDTDLRYYWLAYPQYYGPVQDGNAMVYPPADTLSTHKHLAIKMTLKPATYNIVYIVENLKTGLREFMSFYSTIQKTLETGLFVLQEFDGNTDVDIIRTDRSMMGTPTRAKRYYSSVYDNPVPGKPLFLNFCRSYSYPNDYFYLFTDREGLRLSGQDFTLMEKFDEMFYTVPNYNPQGYTFLNNAEFLINDGKLYLLYINQANDRKFSAAIAGDYNLAPFFPDETITTWQPVEGQMNYQMVVYDQKKQGYLPLQSYASEFTRFKEKDPEALFDVNHIGYKLLYAGSGYEKYFYSIFEDEAGKRYLYLPKFTNIVDNGNLAQEKGIYDLSACADIEHAKFWSVCGAGPIMVYATGNGFYSFNYQGTGDSQLLYNFPSNLEVTCLYLWRPGGHPADSRVVWIGAWDKSAGKGYLYEFEIGPASGLLEANPFGKQVNNPEIFEDFGRIEYMIFKL